MNMVGELVLVRNRLSTLRVAMADEALANAVANLDVVTADLQLSVMKTRMQPVKKVFGRFPRVVRDLARNLKKEVDLELHGEETDLDKNLVEVFANDRQAAAKTSGSRVTRMCAAATSPSQIRATHVPIRPEPGLARTAARRSW